MLYELIIDNKSYQTADVNFLKKIDDVIVGTSLSQATAVEYQNQIYQIVGRAPFEKDIPNCYVGILGNSPDIVELNQIIETQSTTIIDLNTQIDDLVLAITPTEVSK